MGDPKMLTTIEDLIASEAGEEDREDDRMTELYMYRKMHASDSVKFRMSSGIVVESNQLRHEEEDAAPPLTQAALAEHGMSPMVVAR